MRPLFFPVLLLELVALCILWQVAKFMWTGRTEINIIDGTEHTVYVISTGELSEEDRQKIDKKTAPFGEAGKDFSKRKVQTGYLR
jgi:hypothetical protein